MKIGPPVSKPRVAVCLGIVALLFAGRAAAAAEAQPVLSDVFSRVDPAVVEIHIREVDVPPAPGGLPVSVAGLGSGVLITPDGKVLTAAHVVQTADAIEVEFLTGEVIKARVL